MEKQEYYLCSKQVVDHFKPEQVSRPFYSGYEFEKDVSYYVAVFDPNKLQKFYTDVVVPNRKAYSDFWAQPCVSGTMDVSKITLTGIRNKGLFREVEDKIGLTKESNIAMCIKNLSVKFGGTPIDFINKIAPK